MIFTFMEVFKFDMGCVLKSYWDCKMVCHEDGERWILKFIVLSLQMMNKFGILVAVSVAAYAIRQLTIRSWSSLFLPTNCSGFVLFISFFLLLASFTS